MIVKGLPFAVCLILLLAVSGIASAQCDPDSHNDATSALEIGYDETVTGWVCPDDTWDYYYFEVPEGSDISGMITFAAEQSGTTLRIDGPPGSIFPERGTLDAERTFWIPIAAGTLTPGTYYLRVGFYSSRAYDHQYTITNDLTLTGGSECVSDGNDDPEHAATLALNSTVSDWLCAADHIDIWRFHVSDEDEGLGTVSLTADPGELRLYVYDSSATELFTGMTVGGSIDYVLGDGDEALAPGYYYIGVFLPAARSDENSYSLTVTPRERGFFFEGDLFFAAPLHVITPQKCPWPNIRGNSINSSRSTFKGPGGMMYKSGTFDRLELSRSEMENDNKYYRNLIASFHDRLIFQEFPSKTIKCVHAQNMTRVQWQLWSGSHKPPCLAKDGTIYLINRDGRLVCAHSTTGGEIWTRDLPEDGRAAVELAAKYVYTSVYDSTLSSSYVQAWDWQESTTTNDRTGALVWSVGPVQGSVLGIAEDDYRNAVYVQTNRYLYKYDQEDGVSEWSRPYTNLISPQSESEFGPMVGRDRRIWVYTHAGAGWQVFNEDGTTYKSGSYGERIRAACIGTDGRLYIATKTNVKCFDDWSVQVWDKPFGRYIDDMIMDSDDRIYVSKMYYYRSTSGREIEQYDQNIHVIDPSDGRTIFTAYDLGIDVDVVGMITDAEGGGFGMSCLAICENNRLAFLHANGVLHVYNPFLIAYFTPLYGALSNNDD